MREKFKKAISILLFGMLIFIAVGCGTVKKVQNDTTKTSVITSNSQAPVSQTSTTRAIRTSGFCAVGTIDYFAKTAKVLLEDGEIKTVSYTSEPPQKGIVNGYSIQEGKYIFKLYACFPDFSAQYADWIFSAQQRQRRLFYAGVKFLNADSCIFVRYSDTEWRVFKGRNMIKHDATCKGGYFYYTKEVEGLADVVKYIMIVGECGGKDYLSPATADNTKFLDEKNVGFNTGDKNLK